jgi:hypothetical protein
MMHDPSFSLHSIFSYESIDNILLLAHPYCCDLHNQYRCLVCLNILFISLIELGGDWNAFRDNSGAAYNVEYSRVSFYDRVTFSNVWL